MPLSTLLASPKRRKTKPSPPASPQRTVNHKDVNVHYYVAEPEHLYPCMPLDTRNSLLWHSPLKQQWMQQSHYEEGEHYSIALNLHCEGEQAPYPKKPSDEPKIFVLHDELFNSPINRFPDSLKQQLDYFQLPNNLTHAGIVILISAKIKQQAIRAVCKENYSTFKKTYSNIDDILQFLMQYPLDDWYNCPLSFLNRFSTENNILQPLPKISQQNLTEESSDPFWDFNANEDTSYEENLTWRHTVRRSPELHLVAKDNIPAFQLSELARKQIKVNDLKTIIKTIGEKTDALIKSRYQIANGLFHNLPVSYVFDNNRLENLGETLASRVAKQYLGQQTPPPSPAQAPYKPEAELRDEIPHQAVPAADQLVQVKEQMALLVTALIDAYKPAYKIKQQSIQDRLANKARVNLAILFGPSSDNKIRIIKAFSTAIRQASDEKTLRQAMAGLFKTALQKRTWSVRYQANMAKHLFKVINNGAYRDVIDFMQEKIQQDNQPPVTQAMLKAFIDKHSSIPEKPESPHKSSSFPCLLTYPNRFALFSELENRANKLQLEISPRPIKKDPQDSDYQSDEGVIRDTSSDVDPYAVDYDSEDPYADPNDDHPYISSNVTVEKNQPSCRKKLF